MIKLKLGHCDVGNGKGLGYIFYLLFLLGCLTMYYETEKGCNHCHVGGAEPTHYNMLK